MSQRYHYEPCPKCVSLGHDNRGDNLCVYDNGSRHCFSCGFHVFPKYYLPKVKEEHGPKNLLPSDFTREVPTSAYLWLLQYGLPFSYWESHCGYSEKDQRLVFTVGNPIEFSIGRYVGTVPGPRKWYVWGDSHKHCEVLGNGDTIVLVEDLISAHKVAQVTTAIPLFGTKIHPCHLYYLMVDHRPVVLWLDKDQELNIKKQALNLESLINRRVINVTTDLDPKCYRTEEIGEIVRRATEQQDPLCV